MFKHNFCLTVLDSLQNCWQSTGVLDGCVAEERNKTAE